MKIVTHPTKINLHNLYQSLADDEEEIIEEEQDSTMEVDENREEYSGGDGRKEVKMVHEDQEMEATNSDEIPRKELEHEATHSRLKDGEVEGKQEESSGEEVGEDQSQEEQEMTNWEEPLDITGQKRRALTDAEQRLPPSKHAKSQQVRCPLLQERLQWKLLAQGHKQKMSMKNSTPQDYQLVQDFLNSNQLYSPDIPKDGHCLAYAITSALTMADLSNGTGNEIIDQTLQSLATLVKFTPLWAFQQSENETHITCNAEFLRSQIKDPDKFGVLDEDPQKMVEQVLTLYAIWPLKKPLPPDLWGGFDHLRLMASYFLRNIYLMAYQQQKWVYMRFSPPVNELKSATMFITTLEEWRKEILEDEEPIILVLESDHFQPVIPITRKRVKIQKLRSLRNNTLSKHNLPMLKLQDFEEAYKLNNIAAILAAFQEDHLTLDARKELLWALEPANERGEEGIIFYNEHIPADLQLKVLKGGQLETIVTEFSTRKNISIEGARAVIADYQQNLTQEEVVSQQYTQDSDYQPEEEWVTFTQEMLNDWEAHRASDPHLPYLHNKKEMRRFIGRFPQPFLFALRALSSPYQFLQTLPTELTGHWIDAIYAQSIYIQLLAIQKDKPQKEIETWLAKLGEPKGKRFSVYSRSFYQKMTLKSQWSKAKKNNYWDSEELLALDIDYIPIAKSLAVVSELYGTRIPTEIQQKARPEKHLKMLLDLYESKQEGLIEEGIQEQLFQYISLLQDGRIPLSPGF
jgi:hypothetical protein